MLGLIGILYMGARSLQVQKQGVEVAGHNIANVNNPSYSRQRINLATSLTIPTPIGPQGTGADVTSIQRIRDLLLDDQSLVQNMLLRQRDSISGVSLDEEMTDMIKFQKAFEASARLIVTVDEMLQEVVNLKR